MVYKLRSLVVKPVLGCTSSCPTCDLRMELFKDRKLQQVISINEWEKIIEDAATLGCGDFTISGGEPLMYDKLPRLIEIATKNKMSSNLNSNGSLATLENSKSFALAGLTSATVSVYSDNSEIHNRMRNEEGLFERAINAIKYLQSQGNITIYLQTILTNYNIDNFDKFVSLAYQLKVNYICVSYLEGDISKNWLPSFVQIKNFKGSVASRVIDIINKNSSGMLAEEAASQVNSMFSSDSKEALAFSHGEYGKTGKKYCSIPYNFALILSNGDVLPCNGVEYSHNPIMGNIKDNSLYELWTSQKWDIYREARHDWCGKCPMTLHFKMPICHVNSRG